MGWGTTEGEAGLPASPSDDVRLESGVAVATTWCLKVVSSGTVAATDDARASEAVLVLVLMWRL